MNFSDLPKAAQDQIEDAESNAKSIPLRAGQQFIEGYTRAAIPMLDVAAHHYWELLKPDLKAFTAKLEAIGEWVDRKLRPRHPWAIPKGLIPVRPAVLETRKGRWRIFAARDAKRRTQVPEPDEKTTSSRTAPPLAYGEYVSPDAENSTQTWAARRNLAKAITRSCPQFLMTLDADVFPLYRDLAKACDDLDYLVSRANPYEGLSGSSALKLKSALTTWARHFNADEPWILDEALRIMRGWRTTKEWRKSRRWNFSFSLSAPPAIGAPFEFCCEGWAVQQLTWAVYSRSVRAQFERVLSEYRIITGQMAESKGLVRARKKYSPANIEWFALYQIAGMSSTDIANRCAKAGNTADESTVLKGIKAAAELLGWDRLRSSGPRRSRKIP